MPPFVFLVRLLALLALVLALAPILASRGASSEAAGVDGPPRAADAATAPLALDVALPSRLSELGLFADTAALRPAAGVRPYDVRFPLWSDGAAKERHVFLPPGAAIDVDEEGRFEPPVGAIFAKTFSCAGADGRVRRLETRIMRRLEARWEYAVFVWNDGQDDALRTDDRPVTLEHGLPGSAEPYVVPGRLECLQCHAGGGAAGFQPFQLDDALLSALRDEGHLDRDAASIPNREVRGADADEIAALGYLAANCAHCHNPESPAFVGDELDLRHHVARENVVGVDAVRLRRPGARQRVAPGHPEGSALFRVFARTLDEEGGRGDRMPPIGNALVDAEGVATLRRWIDGLERGIARDDR